MIEVCCALITGHNGKVLVTQRSSVMRLPLKWEFPGGKLEPGETEEECIVREIREELGITVGIIKRLPSAVYDDGKQTINLIPFECFIVKGEILLAEHVAFLWLGPEELNNLDWAEADLPVVENYIRSL